MSEALPLTQHLRRRADIGLCPMDNPRVLSLDFTELLRLCFERACRHALDAAALIDTPRFGKIGLSSLWIAAISVNRPSEECSWLV